MRSFRSAADETDHEKSARGVRLDGRRHAVDQYRDGSGTTEQRRRRDARQPAAGDGETGGTDVFQVKEFPCSIRVGRHRPVGAAGFVLSGRDDMRISAATQERVRKVAHDLNYRPNRAAQALRTGKTGTIAFISDEISSTPFAGAAIRGAMEIARAANTTLFLVETLGDTAMEQDLVESLLTRDVDGFVYASMVTRQAPLPAALRDVPVVALNTVVDDSSVTAFVPDDHQGGFDAATALLEAGHDSLAILGDFVASLDQPRPLALDARLAGIREAHDQAGLEMPTPMPMHGPDPEHGRAALRRYLRTHPVPSALLCMNDRLAFGALQALGGRVRPGEDISMVSFDNSDLARWLEPPLATINLPYYEMGRSAMTSLLADDLRSGLHLVPMPLVRHDSIVSETRSGRK